MWGHWSLQRFQKGLSSKFYLEGKDLSFQIDFIDGLQLSYIGLQLSKSS